MPAEHSDSWSNRRPTREDEYFRKRDQELVEQGRRRAEVEAALGRLAEASGVSDPDILREFQRLGYTPETVTLVRVLPLIDVAWADGYVSEAERGVIVTTARARGVASGSRADDQLAHWLANPPPAVVSDGTLHLIGILMLRRSPHPRAVDTRELLNSCTAVASASGGVFGLRAISFTERRTLDRIAYEIERKATVSPEF